MRNATKASTSSAKRRYNKLNTNQNVQRETQRLINSVNNSSLYDINRAIEMSIRSMRNATKASTSSAKRRHNKQNTNKKVPSGYQLHDVAGDGDCLYHAVYGALKMHQGLKSHRCRTQLLETLENTSEFRKKLANFIEKESINKNTKEARDAVRRIRSGGWGRDYEVRKIVDMIKHKFQINLCINMYNAKDEVNYGESFRWQLFTPGLTNAGNCMYVILLHNSGNHPKSEHFQFMTD